MLDPQRVGAFAIAAFVIIVIPGPSVLFAVGQAVAYGRRAAIASVLGNAAGVSVQAACVAAGIGTLVERSITVYTTLKLAGALYLIVLGAQAIFAGERYEYGDPVATPSVRRRFRDGFTVGVLNPKGFVLFTAILPQFVDRSAGYVTMQMLVMALIAASIAVVSDSTWATLAGTAREWLARSPRRADTMRRGGGIMMVGLGLHLAVARRHD